MQFLIMSHSILSASLRETFKKSPCQIHTYCISYRSYYMSKSKIYKGEYVCMARGFLFYIVYRMFLHICMICVRGCYHITSFIAVHLLDYEIAT